MWLLSQRKIERNNLYLLCRNTGKTKPCCDRRMDFVEQNHWGFENIVYGWHHQLVFQVSGKRGWKYHDRFQKAFRNQLCLRGLQVGEVPVLPLPANGLWPSSKAGRLWMQKKCKAEIVSMDHDMMSSNLLGHWKPTWSTVRGDPGCLKESEEEDGRTEQKGYWLEEGLVVNFPV